MASAEVSDSDQVAVATPVATSSVSPVYTAEPRTRSIVLTFTMCDQPRLAQPCGNQTEMRLTAMEGTSMGFTTSVRVAPEASSTNRIQTDDLTLVDDELTFTVTYNNRVHSFITVAAGDPQQNIAIPQYEESQLVTPVLKLSVGEVTQIEAPGLHPVSIRAVFLP